VLSRLFSHASRRPSVVVLALILVFVAAGTVYAASRGSAWRLGYVETMNGYTTGVIGSKAAEIFKAKNTSSASGARAIRAEGDSTSATIFSKNTGGGAAAEFVTNAGKAPFKVNRAAKVANLNADLLDGLSASAFITADLGLGKTQSGVWGEQAAADENGLVVIQFHSRLPAAIPLANTHYVTAPTANCPGAGQAAAGHLCVYEVFSGSMTLGGGGFYNPETLTQGAGRWGVVIYMSQSSQTANAWGSWTVTAPTSLAGVSAVEPPTSSGLPDTP
jgi:hypothetical protein